MKKLIIWILAAGLAAVSAAGCGYRLAGGGYVQKDVSRVAVAVFENRSTESRAGVRFTNELIREITEKSDTRVVGRDDATRRILGTVTSITIATLSRSSATNVAERQVTAVVDVKLVGPEGKILWSVKGFSAQESYRVSTNTVSDDVNRQEAVDTIARRTAERLVSRMMSNF